LFSGVSSASGKSDRKMMSMQSLDCVDLVVERLIWRGRGLARLDNGQVVIIDPGVFPGERIRARIIQSKPDYLRARCMQVLEAHPMRRLHPCKLADLCGGCRFGWLPHTEQIKIKTELVCNELSRALPAEVRSHLPPVQAVSSPKKWRYRWRGQVHVHHGQPCVMPLQGHEPLPCSDCLLLAKPLSRQVRDLCALMDDGRITLAASPKTHQAARAGDALWLDLPLPAFNLDLQVTPDIFFQANWSGNQDLVSYVCAHIDPDWKVADLYAGAGNFALALGRRGNRVLALESDPRAVRAGQENARRLGLHHVRFARRDLARESARRRLQQERVRAVVVDPPRTGAGRKLAQTLDVPHIKRMIWISCDVVNTCRDLKQYISLGWRIKGIQIFDLFPQTWHVETVFILDRDES